MWDAGPAFTSAFTREVPREDGRTTTRPSRLWQVERPSALTGFSQNHRPFAPDMRVADVSTDHSAPRSRERGDSERSFPLPPEFRRKETSR